MELVFPCFINVLTCPKGYRRLETNFRFFPKILLRRIFGALLKLRGGDFVQRFMKVTLTSKPKKVPNQKPSDIIKRSYTYEKKVQKEWEALLRRIFHD